MSMDTKEFKQALERLSKDDKIKMDIKSLYFGQQSIDRYKYKRIEPRKNRMNKYSAESN